MNKPGKPHAEIGQMIDFLMIGLARATKVPEVIPSFPSQARQ